MLTRQSVLIHRKELWIVMITVGILCSSCVPDSKPPHRDFSTTQLLISSLPGWRLEDSPAPEAAHFFNIPNTLAGSTVRFLRPLGVIDDMQPYSTLDQWLMQLPSKEEAARAYNDHYFISDSPGGKYPSHWLPVDGFHYTSPLANQFRVVCDAGLPLPGGSCAIEAQYEEFYSLIFYSTSEDKNIPDDLETIAQAADTKVSEFLKTKK